MNSIEIKCDEITQLMKRISSPKLNNFQYNHQLHLQHLSEVEESHLISKLMYATKVLEEHEEVYFFNSQSVKSKCDQVLAPKVVSDLGKILLDKMEILKNNIIIITEVFDRLLIGIEDEMKVMKSNVPITACRPLIVAYHKLYNNYVSIFQGVKKDYIEWINQVNTRIKSDEEIISPRSCISYITPRMVRDPEQERQDTLATNEYIYSMKEGQSTKEIGDMHGDTKQLFEKKSELFNYFIIHQKKKKLFKKQYCYLSYLFLKKARPGSKKKDHFEEDYELRVDNKRVHNFLNKNLTTNQDKLQFVKKKDNWVLIENKSRESEDWEEFESSFDEPGEVIEEI